MIEVCRLKKSISLMVVFMSIVLLMSCAKKHADFVGVPENQWLHSTDGSKIGSVVYVYRQNSMANIMLSPKMRIDENQSIEIKNNSYQYVLLPYVENTGVDSKTHVFKIDVTDRYAGEHKLSVNIKSGESIYLRLSTTVKLENRKGFNRSFNLEKMPRETALNEIKKTRYIGAINKQEDKNAGAKASESGSKSSDEGEGRFSISKSRNPFDKINE